MKDRYERRDQQQNNLPDNRMNLLMLALFSNPNIEKHLDEAISLIEGVSNTVRSLRTGMDSLHSGMREAQQQIYRIPYGQPNNSYQNNNHSKYNDRNNSSENEEDVDK
ncbi:MAG: hypothetical protein FH758_01105 [Firmicutes bacterium]|nr:hypothetical protein [Bacillota bacterium]